MEQTDSHSRQGAGARLTWALARAGLAAVLCAVGVALFYSNQSVQFRMEVGAAPFLAVFAAGLAVLLGMESNRVRRQRVFRLALIAALLTAVLTRGSLILDSNEGFARPAAVLACCLSLCLLAVGLACTIARPSQSPAHDLEEEASPQPLFKGKAAQRLGTLLWATVLFAVLGSGIVYTLFADPDAMYWDGILMYAILHAGVLFLSAWIVLILGERNPIGHAHFAALILYPISAVAFATGFPLFLSWQGWF